MSCESSFTGLHCALDGTTHAAEAVTHLLLCNAGRDCPGRAGGGRPAISRTTPVLSSSHTQAPGRPYISTHPPAAFVPLYGLESYPQFDFDGSGKQTLNLAAHLDVVPKVTGQHSLQVLELQWATLDRTKPDGAAADWIQACVQELRVACAYHMDAGVHALSHLGEWATHLHVTAADDGLSAVPVRLPGARLAQLVLPDNLVIWRIRRSGDLEFLPNALGRGASGPAGPAELKVLVDAGSARADGTFMTPKEFAQVPQLAFVQVLVLTPNAELKVDGYTVAVFNAHLLAEAFPQVFVR
ncbi:hypothetical protein AURDEDRAFT_131215 [Auricularia subglabra TFB-10046 SS5]|uniref:Uncharacterized protein n=1 Tax=Auricularia subglabra (strain TFB-10046 / SS5) TaxID=717982 RepID=J0D671_AURST|nr:hypothetical protein AURDEDRAFT_131215 [Auricularia subglabra TFB-10046 SS5]